MKVNISTTLEHEIKQEALNNEISFNKALEFGIKFLLAEKGLGYDYPENNLQKKLLKVIELNSTEVENE